MTTPQHVRVFHPEFGWGIVKTVTWSPDWCAFLDSAHKPLRMFIRWTDNRAHGVAGGWYDPDDRRFRVENPQAFETMLPKAS